MPFPSLGDISFTKFTSPEATVAKLKTIVPGTTTAQEVEHTLASGGGSTPEPLWNDLLAYDPPLGKNTDPAGAQLAVDNELLRAARADRADARLLLWVALNLADPRLDTVVREILTDNDGRLIASVVNRIALEQALEARYSAHGDVPRGEKATTNILSLLERCEIIRPTKHGGSIVGIAQTVPTAHAVRGAITLIAERLADRGFIAPPGCELDLALSVGANAWLNLSRDEFRRAFHSVRASAQPQSSRTPLPTELHDLDAQLRRKGQVVLQGPPGAGKTYVARQYVHWVTAARDEESRLQAIVDSLPVNEQTAEGIAAEVVRLGLCGLWDIVQFHPGYDYTDFVRALVAEPHGNSVTFTPQHRVLSLMASVGNKLSDMGYDIQLLLVLDEINRGDIPNIFGELLYALEYRGQAVATPYPVGGSTSLTIPTNLRLLGTMNTADRSIAVIDYALRRRFVFLEVAASDAPILAFSFDDERTRKAALFLYETTAAALSDAATGLQVGPSYFLARADTNEDSLTVLAARYVYEVLPLLSEYALEGEVDASAISDLRRSLGLSKGSAQNDQATDLVTFLTTEPWNPPASQAGLGTSSITGLAPADNGASSGPQTGESSADVDAPDVPMQADGDQSGADVAGSP